MIEVFRKYIKTDIIQIYKIIISKKSEIMNLKLTGDL